MSSTLISFDGKYYEYHGEKKEEQGLAIGGYELDFLSNLVASYLFWENQWYSQTEKLPRHLSRLWPSSIQGKEECKRNKILVRGVPANSEQISGQTTTAVQRRYMDYWCKSLLPTREENIQVLTNNKLLFLDMKNDLVPRGGPVIWRF